MTSELARLEVRDVSGVFAARQVGRGLAAGLSLDRQDQIRVATALSEISRSAVTAGLTAVIAFGVDEADLVLSVTLDGEPPADGVAAAARLMDRVDTNGRAVRMTKRRPPGAQADLELVREQLLAKTHDELPHSISCRVTEWEWPHIRCEIIVERDSQKGIVIGKGGEVLKAVGTAVRATLPEGAYLDLHVKVEKHWQDRDEMLNRLGY